mmetsp:Transcript_30187/g.53464  ORF Transcript_30187/g.53464 Transcript_30187/m.53464 type:complete len:318 (+) Transcript_30187:591-1544(+)
MKRGRDWLNQSFLGRILRYVTTSCYEEPESCHPESNHDTQVDDEQLRHTKLDSLLQRVQDTKGRISELADSCDPPPAKRMKIEVRPLDEPRGAKYIGPDDTISMPFKLTRRRGFENITLASKPLPTQQNEDTQGDASRQSKEAETPESERPKQELLAIPWSSDLSEASTTVSSADLQAVSVPAVSDWQVQSYPTLSTQTPQTSHFARPSFADSPFSRMKPIALSYYSLKPPQPYYTTHEGFNPSPYDQSLSVPLPLNVRASVPVLPVNGFSPQQCGREPYPPGVSLIVQQKAYDLKVGGPSFSRPKTPFVFSLAKQS